MSRLASIAVVLGVVAAAGCRREAGAPPAFTAPVTLGGRSVPAALLEHGRAVYTSYCRPCHGDAGDGQGPSAGALRPPPRDLRLGLYKFGGVPSGELPTDDDFARIITGGLHGTAMLAWQVPAPELDGLIQYVKAFAPRWRRERAGTPVAIPADPWAGREAEARARGARVYHGLAQCAVACHPAYVTRPEIAAFTKELTGIEVRELRADIYEPVLKESDYGVKILPPDFTFTPPRAGDRPQDLYRSIAAGIGGTAMPTWKGVLPEPDLWAMAHYVRGLVALRGTPEAEALRARLLTQPAWTPAPSAAPDAGGEAALR